MGDSEEPAEAPEPRPLPGGEPPTQPLPPAGQWPGTQPPSQPPQPGHSYQPGYSYQPYQAGQPHQAPPPGQPYQYQPWPSYQQPPGYGPPPYEPPPFPGYYVPPPAQRRRRRLVFPLVAIALIVLSLVLGSIVRSSNAGPDPQQPQLGRFAGYIWYGNVTQVSATWRVPTLTPTTPDGSASTWIGVQGPGSNAFYQVGTTEQSYGRFNSYEAFWSDPAQHFHAQQILLGVSAGDEIQARIAFVDGTWQASISDLTDSQSGDAPTFTAQFTNLQMAEWIQEDPTLPTGAAPYPDMSPSTIRQVMVNSSQPAYSSLQPQVMVLPHHVRIVPEPLVNDQFTTKRVPAS